MVRHEYRTFSATWEELEDCLNHLGADGWELFKIIEWLSEGVYRAKGFRIICKREVSEKKPWPGWPNPL